jgi:dCMP deaminase
MSILYKDKYFMDLAKKVAEGSKCVRANYGSLILSADDRIISTGYNGKPRGSCNDHICYRVNLPPNSPKENCCIHSEINALMFSHPLDRINGTMYVSGVPCTDCSLVVMQAQITRLVYLNEPDPLTGHTGNSNNEFWNKYGAKLERVSFTYKEWDNLYV